MCNTHATIHIQLHGVSKAFGAHWVFKELNYFFQSRTSYFIQGVNGSGKSTLLAIIMRFISPSSGTVCYQKAGRTYNPTPQDFSFLSPHLDVPEELTTTELLKLIIQPNNIDPRHVLSEIGLIHAAEKPIEHLSSGMRQRLLLSAAFYKPSSILLLDEPLNHIDKNYVPWCHQHIEARTQAGGIVIVCSHNPEDAKLCDATLHMPSSTM